MGDGRNICCRKVASRYVYYTLGSYVHLRTNKKNTRFKNNSTLPIRILQRIVNYTVISTRHNITVCLLNPVNYYSTSRNRIFIFTVEFRTGSETFRGRNNCYKLSLVQFHVL